MLSNKKIEKVEKKVLPYIDNLFYLGAIISPLIALPQLIKVFYYQDAGGLSLLSWGSWFLGALFFLTYGIVHNQKPIIYLHLTILPIYFGIVLGILIYG